MGRTLGAHVVSVGLQLAAENSCLQEHASVRLLAQRASVNRGTAKRWWDRRNELLVSVCSVPIQDTALHEHTERHCLHRPSACSLYVF